MPPDRLFFENMPKAEQHLHLDGALPVEIIWDIAQRHGVQLPLIREQSPEALADFFRVEPGSTLRPDGAFDAFLEKFQVPMAIMQTRRGIFEALKNYIRHLAEHNYVYAELRFAPQYHDKEGLNTDEVITAALDGIKAGTRESRVIVNLIVCIGREVEAATGLKIAKSALRFQDDGVVAIDLACNEADNPPEKHELAYKETFGSRLKRTVHAGEFAESDDQRILNVHTALDQLNANGLGHAIPLSRHPDLVYQVLRHHVRVESAPLSNRSTGAINGDLRELGLDQLLRRGVLVSLSTDDPLMFGTDLNDVFAKTCRAYDFGESEVQQFFRNAVKGAFCSEAERARIYDEFKRRGFDLTRPS